MRDDLSNILGPVARSLKSGRETHGTQTTSRRRRQKEMNAIAKETQTTVANQTEGSPSRRAGLLADRIEEGAALLAHFAEGLSEAEWGNPVSGSDNRPVGVI